MRMMKHEMSTSTNFMQYKFLFEQVNVDQNKKNEDKTIGIREKLK